MAADLLPYFRTRLLQWRIAGLWALVAAAAASGAVPQSATGWRELLLTLLPIMQLRIWDDLADLAHDRVHHTDRVLVAAATLRSFVVLVCVLGIATASILVLERERWQLAAYAGLLAWLAALYYTSLGRMTSRAVRTMLVLIKYPVIALVASGGAPSAPGWIEAVALYVFFCGYDLRDYRLAGAGKPS